MSKLPLVVIVGPTASGKSALAIQIAQEYGGEIICADSRTVYKGMDIGTAKPTAQERERVRHHLLDVVEPGEPFTAADFKRLATATIDSIRGRDKVPILVGGTGLYIDAVLFDYQFGQPADDAKRAELLALSIEELQQLCRDNNIEIPENYKNKRHLIRAIELGGIIKKNNIIRKDAIVVGISTEKDELRKKIIARTHAMLKQGIVKEIQSLASHYGWESEAMTGNIYRTFRGVVEGTKAEEQAIQDFVQSDLNLAKRQLTWFRRNPHIVWGTAKELYIYLAEQLDVVKR